MTRKEYIQKQKEVDLKVAATVIDKAYKEIPEPFHGYIFILKQKKFYGTKGNNQEKADSFYWQDIPNPYMSVSGRVKMANEEAKENQQKVDYDDTRYDFTNKICQVVVHTMRGRGCGTVKLNSEKIEDSETSAIGRAFASLGYEVLPNGLASAEEMLAYLAKQSIEVPEAKPVADRSVVITPTISTPATDPKMASPEQMKLMYTLISKLGYDKTQCLSIATNTCGRTITSAKELTKEEINKIIQTLKEVEQDKAFTEVIQANEF